MAPTCKTPAGKAGASRDSFDGRSHDLFTAAAEYRQSPRHRYPTAPGSKGHGVTRSTSQAAAAAIAPRVSHLRRVALDALARLGTATAVELVDATGLTREAIQPRLSELRNLGLAAPTGERRANPSGKSAAVLTVTDAGKAAIACAGGCGDG
ncbi:MAG TPA: MarR family winged helix-turn-helix transcriptional regulator [Novosphingobium sp.]|nr:MarR family winged helix-turn-helix transcriptional regulator [Novosphingobium sp.]